MIAALASGVAVLLVGIRLRPRPARVAALGQFALGAPAGTRTPRTRLARRRRWRWRWPGRRRNQIDPADIGEWCGRLAAACRAGDTLVAALRSTELPSSAPGDLATLTLAVDRGVSIEQAAAGVTAHEHVDLALTVIRACAASGTPAAEPLDRAAGALRARAAEAAERTTQSAQARLSAIVMTVLPVAMLATLLATSPSVRAAVASPAGMVCLVAGGLLNVVGWRWMRRIIDQAAR